ncbi:MAG: GspE/PulE family protein, partial [Desulfatiglandales bacterium]
MSNQDHAPIPRHGISSLVWDFKSSKVVDQFIELLKDAGLEETDIREITELVAEILKIEGHPLQAIDLIRSLVRYRPELKELSEKINRLHLLKNYSEKLGDLISNGTLKIEVLEEAIETNIKNKKSVEYVLVSEKNIPKELIGKALSHYYGVPFIDYDPSLVPSVELLSKLKKNFLLDENWVPIKYKNDSIYVLVDDPFQKSKLIKIQQLLKTDKIVFCVGIKEDIQSYIELFYSRELSGIKTNIGHLDLNGEMFDEEEIPLAEDETLNEQSNEVVRFVDQILINAYSQKASDIHLEPSTITRRVHVRYRIDGVLREITTLPLRYARPIISRLKIMANLDISEKRLPQDGKIYFLRKGIPRFEIRIATVPTAGGYEDAVLRILAKAGVMKLEEMGLEAHVLGSFRRIISQPYGLILVVGPTGSGKTTTLHAVLAELNRPGVKIWTAEDPIEITQKGLRQVEVKPKIGLDFARVMRAFLRADPDIIMIGEMRDFETASIAVEASLTGHLVLSTLHTNSAPETITRLLDMGLNAINFSDSILGILAQRLLRRLCPRCKEPYRPETDQYQELLESVSELSPRIPIPSPQELILYKPKGCSHCSGVGYKGRLGIY